MGGKPPTERMARVVNETDEEVSIPPDEYVDLDVMLVRKNTGGKVVSIRITDVVEKDTNE